MAAACVVAAEEGSLDLDAPVAEHLPAYDTASKRAITARHLLAHASGLPESDRSGETVAWRPELVKIDFQNVKTTLINPATRALTRPLKLS